MNDPCPRHRFRYRLNLSNCSNLCASFIWHGAPPLTSNCLTWHQEAYSDQRAVECQQTAVTRRWKVSERVCLNEVLLPRRPYVTADPTQTEPGVNPLRTYVWTCKRPSSAGFLRAGANSDETTMYLNSKLHREFNKYNLPQGQYQSICIGL